jgi:hypothetical protein
MIKHFRKEGMGIDIFFLLLESLCIGTPLGCVSIGLLGLMCEEAQPQDYIIIIFVLKSIEQLLYPI